MKKDNDPGKPGANFLLLFQIFLISAIPFASLIEYLKGYGYYKSKFLVYNFMAKILIIDDDPDVRTVMNILLKKQGHEVETAARKRRSV